MLKKNDTLCLIGTGDFGEEIPFNYSDMDFMYIGFAAQKYEYIVKDRNRIITSKPMLIDIHSWETRSPEYQEWLKEDTEFIKLMQKDFYFIKIDCYRFPLDTIIKKFNTRYFLWTGSYMIAWAMYMGYKEIRLFGINMLYDDDYIQKYNCEYWLGRAEQAGIKITISDKCDLLRCDNLYGYEAVNTLAVYQQKYMNELKNKLSGYIITSKYYMEYAEDVLRELCYQQPKFMEEILNRHGILGPLGKIDSELKKSQEETEDEKI